MQYFRVIPRGTLSKTEQTVNRPIVQYNINSFMTTPLLCKSMDWFLYDNGFRHKRVKGDVNVIAAVIDVNVIDSLTQAVFCV